jgi:hypothetical protein
VFACVTVPARVPCLSQYVYTSGCIAGGALLLGGEIAF